MLRYIRGAFMSCNCRFRSTVINLSYDYGVSSQIHLVIFTNCDFFLKEQKKLSETKLSSRRVHIRAGSSRFSEVREIFGVGRILIIYSNMGKTAGPVGSNISGLKLQAVLRIHRNYWVKWTWDCTEKTSPSVLS